MVGDLDVRTAAPPVIPAAPHDEMGYVSQFPAGSVPRCSTLEVVAEPLMATDRPGDGRGAGKPCLHRLNTPNAFCGS